MHMQICNLRPNTYCMYKAKKLHLAQYFSNLASDVGVLRTTEKTNIPKLIQQKFHTSHPFHVKRKSGNSINKNICSFALVKRYCSRCTFVDGKIPENFRTSPPWRILFFGTDEFSLFTLKSLNDNRLRKTDSVIESIEVVSRPPDKKNRKIPVRSYAEESGLQLYDWPISTPPPDRYDVGVLVSFGHLIPGRILHSLPYGILNVHPSLLPRWRGASPLMHTILNGDTETGISIMEIRPKHFDIGPILMQKKFGVPPNCSTRQLHDMLGPIGADMLIQSLYNLPTLEKLEVPQLEKGVTYAHKLTPDMAYIDWEHQTVDSISRHYRAINDTMFLKSHFGSTRVRFRKMVDVSDQIDQSIIYFYGTSHDHIAPGTPCYSKHSRACWIKCKDGWVGFKELLLKNWIKAENFYGIYMKNPKYKDTVFLSHQNHLMESVYQEKSTASSF